MSTTDNAVAARLRALSINVVLEAMITVNRGGQSITDDDAGRIIAIEQLLHLRQSQGAEFEHAPLTVANQQPVTPALAKITDLLDKAEADTRVQPRPSLSVSRAKAGEAA